VLQLNFLHCFLAGKKILPRNTPKKPQDTKHMPASLGLSDRERQRDEKLESGSNNKGTTMCAGNKGRGKTRTHQFRDAFRVRVTMLVSYWTLAKM
jgi:hypothetical protein